MNNTETTPASEATCCPSCEAGLETHAPSWLCGSYRNILGTFIQSYVCGRRIIAKNERLEAQLAAATREKKIAERALEIACETEQRVFEGAPLIITYTPIDYKDKAEAEMEEEN